MLSRQNGLCPYLGNFPSKLFKIVFFPFNPGNEVSLPFSQEDGGFILDIYDSPSWFDVAPSG